MFPELTFICYHSGFEPGIVEGPFDPDNDRGVDRFIQAYRHHDYRPNEGNVFAELGSCWRHYMSKPDQAAHLLGPGHRGGELGVALGQDPCVSGRQV